MDGNRLERRVRFYTKWEGENWEIPRKKWNATTKQDD
jgi:hypothetical protein